MQKYIPWVVDFYNSLFRYYRSNMIMCKICNVSFSQGHHSKQIDLLKRIYICIDCRKS